MLSTINAGMEETVRWQRIYRGEREDAEMSQFMIYFKEARPQFLILTPICVAVGAAAAHWQAGHINLLYLAIAMVGGIAAHTAVNVLNDYHDFKSGLDFKTPKTPFSGGSGMLPRQEMPALAALIFGLLALAVTIAVGIFFFVLHGWGVFLILIPGVLLVVSYTEWITRRPLLCLLAPGLGFGPCMVLGTYFALQGRFDGVALAASIVPGFLVSNLLLLNQFPDAEADRTVGRRHLPILIGKRNSAIVYAVFALSTYLWLIIGTILGFFPPFALLALLPIPIVLRTIWGIWQSLDEEEAIIPFLGQNVVVTLLTPLLLAIGLFIA
ncbi:MAG: prenyltransferase [Bacillota bacterium]